jgi:hypothetical protein
MFAIKLAVCLGSFFNWTTCIYTAIKYRSLSAIVAQSKNCPFGVNTTIELKNITATSDDRVI